MEAGSCPNCGSNKQHYFLSYCLYPKTIRDSVCFKCNIRFQWEGKKLMYYDDGTNWWVVGQRSSTN